MLTQPPCADVIAGKAKYVKCDDVRYLYLPQYENCSVKAVLEQARNYPDVELYLPVAKERA